MIRSVRLKKLSNNNIINLFFLFSLIIYVFTYIYKYQYGNLENYWLFFFDRSDRFADTLKIIFSFSFIFSESELFALNVPEKWIYGNPYTQLVNGSRTWVMSLPPLTVIFLAISAYIAKFIGGNYLFIYSIYLIILLVIFFKLFVYDFKDNKKIIFILFSFPFIFLLERGNIQAAIAGICLYLLFKKFWLGIEFNKFDLLFFLIACSIRPNYLVFGLIFLFKDNLLSNIKNFLKIGISYLGFNGILFFLASLLVKDYNFNNFIYMVTYYTELGIKYSPWNSSLYNSIYNIYMFGFDFIKSSNFKATVELIDRVVLSPKLENLIILFYSLVIIFSYFRLKINKITRSSFLITLSAGCALMTSPFADYHLVIFIFLTLLLISDPETKSTNKLNLVLMLIVLIPKFHSFSPYLNISNITNVIMLNLLILNNYKPNNKS